MLKNTNIKYIIEFDRNVFPDADVNTAITILEKSNDHKDHEMKFIR
ncbi:unnamed protein product, partial [marine sediment metagenome]